MAKLTRIQLRRFRCFEDSGAIDIKPLTIIFGRNNAGKSSILQSLLLLRQTMDAPEYGDRLNLRGPLYPAGSFSDVVHRHQSSQSVELDFNLSVSDSLARAFGLKPSEMGEAYLSLEYASDEPNAPRLQRLCISGSGIPPVEIRRGRGRGGPLELRIDNVPVGGEREGHFRFSVNSFLPVIFMGPPPAKKGPPPRATARARLRARVVLVEFERLLRSIRAVGPFRTPPERRYDYQGRPSDLVDIRGANAVQALIEDSLRRGSARGTLTASVNRWLARLSSLRLMPLRRLSASVRIYELRLRDIRSGRWANFADVGFGIGQAMPVLVEGLRTAPTGVFIVQEPEIHLHPDAQLAMADFLVDLCKSGRTVIVETHSEAVLLRVRRAVAETSQQKHGLKAEDVSVVCVVGRDGDSQAIPMNMDHLGQIQKWPKGFLEDVTQERLELLTSVAQQVES